MKKINRLVILFGFLLFLYSSTSIIATGLGVGITEKITNSNGGVLIPSRSPFISDDGRYVYFDSAGVGLPQDNNYFMDIYSFDRQSNELDLVSVNTDGNQGNNSVYIQDISSDGRFVVFSSTSSMFDPRVGGTSRNMYVRDVILRTTEVVSVTSEGMVAGGVATRGKISANGRYVAFSSQSQSLLPTNTDKLWHVYVHDRQTGTTELVSKTLNEEAGITSSYVSDISDDGRYVLMYSSAENLMPGTTNGLYNLIAHDRITGENIMANVASDGSLANQNTHDEASFSKDGTMIIFSSNASNLVEDDTNNLRDVFMHSIDNDATERISTSISGDQGNGISFTKSRPQISEDGRFVVFGSTSTNLVDYPNLSSIHGRAYLKDRKTGEVRLIDINRFGEEPYQGAYDPTLTADGLMVVFSSFAYDLVSSDTNNMWDIFLRTYEFSNQNPIANSGEDFATLEGIQILLDGSISTDPDGIEDIVSYEWNFGDGSPTQEGQVLEHTYVDDGIYTATLKIVDSYGETDSDTTTITVNNADPTADFSFDKEVIIKGESATISFTNQYDSGENDLAAGFTYSYDCTNDGIFELENASNSNYTCLFNSSGRFSSKGVITDKDGGSSTYYDSIHAKTTSEAILELVDLVTSYNLHNGIDNSLDAKLNSALQAIEDINLNNNVAAVNSLEAFINAVEARAGDKIALDQTDELITLTQRIIASLS